MSSFIRGTLLLIIAAFVGECVEFVVNMVLARELGERGLGMYMAILPTIFLIVLLASLELPVSISKYIAETDKKFHQTMLEHVLRLTIIVTAVMILIVAVVLPLIPAFQHYHPALKWLVLLVIPMSAFSSIARGYFMGKQQVGKIAAANLLRKVIQLILLVVLFDFFQYETSTAVLIAFCTFVGSEFFMFIYLIYTFTFQYLQMKKKKRIMLLGKEVAIQLMGVSIPTTGLRVFHALTHAVQPFLIRLALLHAGVAEEIAIEQFGMLAGVAMAIGFFPSFIGHSLMTMLIPEISKAYAEKDVMKMQTLLQKVMATTILYGVPAILVFNFLAEPLTNLFFHSPGAAIYLQMLCPYFLLHFLIIPMQAYLIGLGLMKEAFYHSVWATIMSYITMYILGSMYTFQMDGIIIGMNMGALLLASMHYVTICKKIGVSLTLTPIK
ncbi:oligosaccharide flippase family protein [Bacillaceae bacterium Marseille-Q3522]|nr:oligosaccharide flippase family protein [Bacillaceae bacterium Marseille-Q3522]